MVIVNRYRQPGAEESTNPDIERIYFQWNKALSNNDPDALLALYSPDAELKRFFEILSTRKPKLR